MAGLNQRNCLKNYIHSTDNKWLFIVLLILSFLFKGAILLAQPDGEKLFKQNCSSCHQVSDTKLVGPGLKDVTKRRSQDWLIQFIKDSQKLVKEGNADAVKVFEENNKVVMPPQNFSDDELKAVLAYIDSGGVSAKKEITETANTQIQPTKENGESSILKWILISFSILLLIIIYVLYSVKKAMDIAKGKIAPENGFNASSENIGRWIIQNKKTVAIGVIIILAGGFKMTWDALSGIGISQGYAPEQPIAFSHKIHAGDNKISCVYCHSSATKGKTAGIPSANVCMNCHKYIQEGATTGTEEIAKIYKALDFDPSTQVYGNNPVPIKWIRIHNLPDLAYFNHSQHVVAGKQQCQTCHGKVEEMNVVEQHASLTMGWCVDCHKNTEVSMAGNAYYDKLHKEFKEKYKGQKITVEKIGGLDCAKCHY